MMSATPRLARGDFAIMGAPALVNISGLMNDAKWPWEVSETWGR